MTNEEWPEGQEPESNIESLSQALAEEKEKAESYLASWQRAQADFANYKRRVEQEKEDTIRFANTQLILTLLPVLDDLQRAFESVSPGGADEDWVEGIRLIERGLRSALESQGLSEIKAVGEVFDPNLHEAAIHREGEEGKVIGELRRGYKLHDRVIRPSTVIVGNGEGAEDKEE